MAEMVSRGSLAIPPGGMDESTSQSALMYLAASSGEACAISVMV